MINDELIIKMTEFNAGDFLQDGLERVRELVGVGERTCGRGKDVQEPGENVVVAQAVAHADVGEVEF